MSSKKRDGSKLSFSELDKMRRERRHSGKSEDVEPRASKNAQTSYRAALERAFDSGRLAEFAATLQAGRNSALAGLAKPSTTTTTPSAQEISSGKQTDEHPDSESSALGAAGSKASPTDSSAGNIQSRAGRGARESPEIAERRKLSRAITEAETRRAMDEALSRYIDRYSELPRDMDILEKALGHQKTAVVLHALERLEAWIRSQKPRRSRSMAVQLTILEESHDDSDVRALAGQIRAALG